MDRRHHILFQMGSRMCPFWGGILGVSLVVFGSGHAFEVETGMGPDNFPSEGAFTEVPGTPTP